MSKIKNKAFSLLARRDYFSKELEKKLFEKGFEKSEICSLIKDLKEQGWLNDRDLAKRVVSKLREKGYGARVISQKLRFRAGEIFVSIDDGDISSLIFKKYLKRLPQDKNKVIAALIRRGFSYDLIDKALRTITEEMELKQ